jgi:flagellar hook-length control protein FliK
MPQADAVAQARAAASQVADVAATTTSTTASDTVPADEKGGRPTTGEVTGGQQVTREQASQKPATQASGDQSGVSVADRVRFVQRVARAFGSLGDQGGTIRLRLHPAELGALRLEVTVHNGAMTARLEAETQAAQGMLLENLPALRERLAEQNIRVERFDVDLMGQSSGGTADGANAQAQSEQGQSQKRPPYNDYRSRGVESGNEPRRSAVTGGRSGFDVIV